MALQPDPVLVCFCGASFPVAADLEDHRRARGHFKGHVCKSNCSHSRLCSSCGKYCPNLNIYKDHINATGHGGHCYCAECDHLSQSETELQKHLASKAHASEFHCCDCDMDFESLLALNLHLKGRKHVKAPTRKPNSPKSPKASETPKSLKTSGILTPVSLTCTGCNRTFKKNKDLQQHLKSLKHIPLSSLKCPLGESCQKVFTSPSALLQHLESGNCSSGMTRSQLNHLVRKHDTDRLLSVDLGIVDTDMESSTEFSESTPGITEMDMNSEWSMCSAPAPMRRDTNSRWSMCSIPTPEFRDTDSMSEWSLLTPDPNSDSDFEGSILFSLLPSQHLTAPNRAKNGFFKCPQCPKQRKPFKTAAALADHMASPAHAPKMYRCPISIITPETVPGLQSQYKVFSTLSGLSQHIESGACKGGNKAFKEVMGVVEEKLRGLGLRDVVLLGA